MGPAAARAPTRSMVSLVTPTPAATRKPCCFTSLTFSAWALTLMFLCITPIPPCRAIAMAMGASVTVSMAAETRGMSRVILRVKRVESDTCAGVTSE